MKRLIIVAATASILAGCTLEQKQMASQTAAAALDALCNNLSVADQTAREILTSRHANGTAFRVEADAVAAVQGICNSRPVANAAQALVAASAAFAKVVAAEQGR